MATGSLGDGDIESGSTRQDSASRGSQGSWSSESQSGPEDEGPSSGEEQEHVGEEKFEVEDAPLEPLNNEAFMNTLKDEDTELWLLRVPRHSSLRNDLVGSDIFVDSDESLCDSSTSGREAGSFKGNYVFRDHGPAGNNDPRPVFVVRNETGKACLQVGKPIAKSLSVVFDIPLRDLSGIDPLPRSYPKPPTGGRQQYFPIGSSRNGVLGKPLRRKMARAKHGLLPEAPARGENHKQPAPAGAPGPEPSVRTIVKDYQKTKDEVAIEKGDGTPAWEVNYSDARNPSPDRLHGLHRGSSRAYGVTEVGTAERASRPLASEELSRSLVERLSMERREEPVSASQSTELQTRRRQKSPVEKKEHALLSLQTTSPGLVSSPDKEGLETKGLRRRRLRPGEPSPGKRKKLAKSEPTSLTKI